MKIRALFVNLTDLLNLIMAQLSLLLEDETSMIVTVELGDLLHCIIITSVNQIQIH